MGLQVDPRCANQQDQDKKPEPEKSECNLAIAVGGSASQTFAASSSVSVAVGSSQTVSITFTSSDGRSITGFGVSGTLGLLPAGWSGPTTASGKQLPATLESVTSLNSLALSSARHGGWLMAHDEVFARLDASGGAMTSAASRPKKAKRAT